MKIRTTKKNKGFTLIEVMIATTIIAITASIALPLMAEKIMRHQVKENLRMTDEFKPVISEYFNKNSRTLPTDNKEAGVPVVDGQYASSIVIRDGQIITTFGNQANKKITNTGTQIVLIPHKTATSYINWECKFMGDQKFAPYICQNRGVIYEDYVDPTPPPAPTTNTTTQGAIL